LGGGDTISGDRGHDTILGGVGGDTIYGDNADADAAATDGEDIIAGDNATILYAGDAYPGHDTEGRLYTLGNTPIISIETTDTEEATGGVLAALVVISSMGTEPFRRPRALPMTAMTSSWVTMAWLISSTMRFLVTQPRSI
jgi:hypothetical protein